MRDVTEWMRTGIGWLRNLLLALLLYQSGLHAFGQTQDPLLKNAAQTLKLDKCPLLDRGEIPEHPARHLTPYPALWVWLKENPYWLCRFR